METRETTATGDDRECCRKQSNAVKLRRENFSALTNATDTHCYQPPSDTQVVVVVLRVVMVIVKRIVGCK